MYNLFYIESPLQLMSAMEAKKQLKLHNKKNVLVINLLHTEEENNRQILSLVNQSSWEKVILRYSRKKFLLEFISMSLFILGLSIKYKNKIEYYFYGEFRNIFMTIIPGVLKSDRTILLDDGGFSVTAQNYYIRKGIFPFDNSKLYKLSSQFIRMNKSPDLFSFYENLTLIEGQVNLFNHLGKKRLLETNDEILFFGSKFYEAGTMSLEDELNIIDKVASSLSRSEFLYIPHRSESVMKLNMISELGLRVKKLGKPAELYFDQLDSCPKVIVSYYSTVLYSAYSRFDGVKLMSVDVAEFLKDKSSEINAECIYSYYRELGIPVIRM